MEENIPLEIIEEILMNLPSKSLGRFSAVSKEWKAMISDKKFIRRHQIRGSLPGRERILISHWPGSLMPATTRRLSSLSSNQFDQPFISPLQNVQLIVSCSDMWCVFSRRSYFLVNPSMGTYKKIPPPWRFHTEYYFGMGFDSLADDYKILKVPKHFSGVSALYSLRSNSWRQIDQPFPVIRSNAVFVSNALHWMAKSPSTVNDGRTIVSFDLSTEKYADNIVQPPFDQPTNEVGLTVLRGNLCLYLNYHAAKRFVLWEMQEYGDGKSWTMIMDSDVSSIVPRHGKTMIKPLYLDQNGWILMKASTSNGTAKIFLVYEDEWQIIWKGRDCGYTGGLLYAETLVSPATYCNEVVPLKFS